MAEENTDTSTPQLARPGRTVPTHKVDVPNEVPEKVKRKRIVVAVTALGLLAFMSFIDGAVQEKKRPADGAAVTRVMYRSTYTVPSRFKRLFCSGENHSWFCKPR